MIDLESLGAGAASGFVSTILTLLGWNRRISKLEDTKADRILLEALEKKLDETKRDLKEAIYDVREGNKSVNQKLDAIYILLSKEKLA